MGETEVIKGLMFLKEKLYNGIFQDRLKCIDLAIAALEEVQKYRQIGTVEECREAVEKQKPKKIIIESYCPTECPTCGHELSKSLGDGYYKYPIFLKRCPNCGQVIQWYRNWMK